MKKTAQKYWVSRTVREGLHVWLFVSILFLLCTAFEHVSYFGESGYGDAAVSRMIQEIRSLGLYPDPADQNTLGELRAYGPMFYVILYVSQWFGKANDLLVMRGLVLLGVLGSAFAISSLASIVFRIRAWRGLVLFCALSLQMVRPWVVQLRGDFFAVGLSISALTLIVRDTRFPLLFAALGGVLAGLAPTIKMSYISAAFCGFVWLLIWRQWLRGIVFASAAGVTLLAVYGGVYLLEPNFIHHMALFSKAISSDHVGQFRLFLNLFRDPLLICGVACTLSFSVRWRSRRMSLLLLYIAVSAGIAFFTSAHAGSNVNYYFESGFAIAPFAAIGILRIGRFATRYSFDAPVRRFVLGCGLIGFAYFCLLPFALDTLGTALSSRGRVAEKNHRFQELQKLRGLRVLSFSPDATLATGSTLLSDPWALSYFASRGSIDLNPLLSRITAREFDLIVIDREQQGWRGTPVVHASAEKAIAEQYEQRCATYGLTMFVRRGPDGSLGNAIPDRLRSVGCVEAARPEAEGGH